MFAYASRTGTKRNLSVLREHGWGLMVSAKGVLRTEGFARYCLDNGAWWAHQNNQRFDAAAFELAYARVGCGADFTVLPDIVAGGLRSLEFSLRWRDRLGPGRFLLAVQDGMTARDVAGYVGPQLGIFVGGTTRWKEDTLGVWGLVSRHAGAYLHVGRVNSVRRIFLCVAFGVDSFDGSSVSRYAKTVGRLDNARKQLDMLCVGI